MSNGAYSEIYVSDLKKTRVGKKVLPMLLAMFLLASSLIVILPDEANAETRPGGTLKNDQPARVYTTGWWWTSIPDELQFKAPSKSNHYTAVAIQNREDGEDFDLFAYSDYDMENEIASSTMGSDIIDFVVIDGHTYTGDYKYIKVSKFTGQDWTDGIRIESDYHCYEPDLYGSDPDANGALDIGRYRYSMFEYHGTGNYDGTLRGDYPLVNMYDVYLGAGGTYDFSITSVPSAERLSMYLFKGSGSPGDAIVTDSASAGGGSLEFSYEPEASGYYGLCVIDENNGYTSADNYTILITSDFGISASPVSRLIAPGMNTSYEVDISSLGVTQDIDLHYRWRTASSNTTTPAGAIAKLNRDSVNTGGVGSEKVYLNISTTSSMAAGTYYLAVYANDTGVGGSRKGTEVVLRVSTSPDFFLSASPEGRVISPGSSAKYTIDMDTINNFTASVTISGSSQPSEGTLSYSFSPNPFNASTPASTLTLGTTSSTPKGDYLIVITGSGGGLTRYSNVSLTVKEPIDIQVISPATGEIVSGVYTFKVKAGSPPTTDSVKFTFGGKMANLGTLNAFYNSGTGQWERAVNTFTFNDGSSFINITAIDSVGGETYYGPVNFTLSNSAPNPIISTPLDRTYVTGSSLPIKVNTTSYVISVRFRVDQNAWSVMTRSGNVWSGSYDTTLITDGEHTLSVEAKDSAGLTGLSSITIFIDNTDPTCAINSPIDGQYIEGSYTFRTVATDTVGIDHVNITIFGTTTTLPYNPLTSSYEYTVTTSTKPDGMYTAYSTAFDKVGQSTQSTVVSFFIDNNAPSLSINDPMDGEIIGGTYPISITSYDIHLNKVEYMIDSSGWQVPAGSMPNWQVLLNTSTLTDGDHTLTVRSLDNASHLTGQSIDFTVDNTYPSCNIVSPFIGAYIEGVVTFKVSSTDTVGIEKVVMTAFGQSYQMTYNLQTGYYEYTINTLALADGNYSMSATSYDRSSKSTDSFGIFFKIDNQDPELTVNGIQNGDYISGTFVFDVNATDAFLKDVRYSIDGGGWLPVSTSWDTTTVLDGQHTVTVRARDEAGHSTTQVFIIKVDNNRPVCAVNGPVANEFIKGAYKFRISASDSVGIDRVEINVFGINFTAIYSSSSGYYEFTSDTTTQTDGGYECYAIVHDLSGWVNTSSKVAFQVDNNAPVLRINDPIDGSFIDGMVTVNVTATDVFLDKVEYDVDGSGWVGIGTPLNTTILGDGVHKLSIRALDEAGHITSTSINVKVDNNNPAGSISTPVALQFLEGTARFSVIASDAVGIGSVKITVFGSTVDMSYNSGTSSYDYWTDTRLITDGSYSMTVNITDLSGKKLMLGPRTFQIDNNAPVLRINHPLAGSYLVGMETMNVTASDTYLDRIEYNVDGTGYVMISNVLNTTQFADGTHVLTFKATDGAGHSTISSVTVFIDNTAPSGSISAPVAGQFLEGTSVFSIFANDKVGIASVTITVFGSEIDMNYNSGSGTYEYRTDTRLIPDGTYDMTVRINDLSGKTLVLGPRTFFVDNNAPVVRIIHPIEGSFIEGIESLNVSAVDVFLDKVEYNIDGTGWVLISQTLNTTQFSDGSHMIQFRAVDLAGHITMTSSSIVIDNTVPYGAIASPVALQFISGPHIFKVVASDAVGIGSVRISVFNTTLDMNYNTETGYYELTTDTSLLDDGTYNMTIIIQDLSGKVSMIGPRDFYLDNHVPQLKVYNINNGDILSELLLIDHMANDTFLDSVEYEVDSTGWYDIEVPLDTSRFGDGPHVIKIRATDLSDKSITIDFDVRFDNIGPTCTVNSPVENEFVEGTITIKVTAFDIVGIDHVVIKVYDLEAKVPYNSATGYYEYTANTVTWGSGEDGVRNITAIAYDFTGKSYTYGPINFNIDNRPPTININSPKDGDIVSGLFFFDVNNADIFKKGTDYNIDGASWQPVSIGWNTVLIPDGPHEVNIRATDLAGHMTMVTLTVFVDNNRPEITMVTPSEGEFVHGTYVFRVVAFDEVGIQRVSVNIAGDERPLSYNTQTGYYEYLMDTRLYADGNYVVTATVTDVADRVVTTPEINYRIDNEYPTLRVESPVKGQMVSGMFVIRAQTTDTFPGTVRYAIDHTTWYDLTTPWNSSKVIDGYHTVTVMTEDLAGHRTEFDVEVIVDNGKPVIGQSSITSGQVMTGITTLRFNIYDSIGISQVKLSIDDSSPFDIYRGEGGAFFEHILNTRLLSDGDHILKLSAIDRAGNTVSSSYGIRIDNTGPTISLDYYWIERDAEVREGDVREGTSVVFVANVEDPSGVSTVMINIDSMGWREMTRDTNESNPNKYLLYWPTTGGGAHMFQVRSVDTNGNEYTISGMINVKEVKDRYTVGDFFGDALPYIWLLLFIVLIAVVLLLLYFGILTKWAKGEGYRPKEKKEPENEDSPGKGSSPRRFQKRTNAELGSKDTSGEKAEMVDQEDVDWKRV